MKKGFVKKTFNKLFVTDDIFWKNEVQANQLVALAMLLTCILFFVSWLLNRFGFFELEQKFMDEVMIQVALETLIPWTLGIIFKGQKKWIKYLFMIEFVAMNARLDSILGFNSPLLIVIPVILAARYFSVAFTTQIMAFTIFCFTLSSIFSPLLGTGILDLNFVPIPEGVTLVTKGTLLDMVSSLPIDRNAYTRIFLIESYLPRLMAFGIISVIAINISKRGKDMVLSQADITKKSARIESELSIARNIQLHMLPSIFPPFPEYKNFEIYAKMQPAKEVGGDFYDYFLIGENKICMVVSDVSGKGVPAAFFMVIARTLIKNFMTEGLEPCEVFTKVNNMLLEGNEAMLFVTSWMGVLDLESGDMTFVNAGHNPPVVVSKEGEATYLRTKPELVLAGIEGMTYTQHHYKLSPGDQLFIYTDGVTEATNVEKELYGEERLLQFLKSHSNLYPRDLVDSLYEDINRFDGDAEQFDDITMLSFRLLSLIEKEEHTEEHTKEFDADVKELSNVTAFVDEYLESHEAKMDVMFKIDLSIEEAFVNIASYAYGDKKGKMTLSLSENDGVVTFTFRDHGMPFNPLEREEVDLEEQKAEEKIGGLGIFLVKKNMDDVQYVYENEMNVLTLKKKIR